MNAVLYKIATVGLRLTLRRESANLRVVQEDTLILTQATQEPSLAQEEPTIAHEESAACLDDIDVEVPTTATELSAPVAIEEPKPAAEERREDVSESSATSDEEAQVASASATSEACDTSAEMVESDSYSAPLVEAWRPMEQKDIDRLRRRHGDSEKFYECLQWELTYGAFLFQHLQPSIEEWEALHETEQFLRSMEFIGDRRNGCAYNIQDRVPHPDDLYRQCLYKCAVLDPARRQQEEEERMRTDPVGVLMEAMEHREWLRALQAEDEKTGIAALAKLELSSSTRYAAGGAISKGRQGLRSACDMSDDLEESMDEYEDDEDAPTDASEVLDDGLSEGQQALKDMYDMIDGYEQSVDDYDEDEDISEGQQTLHDMYDMIADFQNDIADYQESLDSERASRAKTALRPAIEPANHFATHAATLAVVSDNADDSPLNGSDVASACRAARHSRRPSTVNVEKENGALASRIPRPRARPSVLFSFTSASPAFSNAALASVASRAPSTRKPCLAPRVLQSMATKHHVKRVTLTSKKNWWMVELDDDDQPNTSANSFSSSEETAVAFPPPGTAPGSPRTGDHHPSMLDRLHHHHRLPSRQPTRDASPAPPAPEAFNIPRHPSSIFSFPTPTSYAAPPNPTAHLAPVAHGSASELFKCIVKKPEVVQLEINGEMQTNAGDVTTQFLAELRVYTRVARHRNIAAFLGCLEGVGMVLEWIDGRTLYDALREGALRPAKKVDYHNQLLDGLTHLHSFRLSHGDLSLLNVQVTRGDDVVKLLDFGRSVSADSMYASPDDEIPPDPFAPHQLVRAASSSTPSSSAERTSFFKPHELLHKVEIIYPGTRPFSAPEILRGECADALLADAYGFGMILVCLDRGTTVDVKPWDQRKDLLPKGFLDGLEVFGERAAWYLTRWDLRRPLRKEDAIL
ncbi:hypothetical protein PUNSTDRAFT_124774 [Punctularia strigosozonata HHB-11173 SS5]|uniref:uncharacterized protein n=1 Tax=Punctularia strigosozonata (strain HHB-11173) TaxID=741275 RepID=UPI0004416D0C|nr:uncharacterized protein PUNSTDRAFT_124774 [Punctularia strigosozonata HHB-11173 SS5]EIN11406.1 hypothetical protein PUNSTDRAFT_124774 [Punctularia strigosozonata HHB-11173 SS5]